MNNNLEENNNINALNEDDLDTNFDVPDELDIILHTSVPLLGKFYYSPSMSIKKENLITQKNLIFNPLIKLDPNLLKNIPDYEQRVSHFFNRTSFETMVYNYSSIQLFKISKYDIQKKKNSLQFNDNINNNLSFVLDTIFEPGQTLYLGGKSFTIVFYKIKSKKPRITNKIDSIRGDPNQTIYDTRRKLRNIGKKNKILLDKLQEDMSDNIDDNIDDIDSAMNATNSALNTATEKAKGFFNDLSNKIPFYNNPNNSNKKDDSFTGGGYNNCYVIEKNFKTEFDLNDNSFLRSFSKFISIQINNYNAQNDYPIVYFVRGVWHGIDNISTTNSVVNFFKKHKAKSLAEMTDALSTIGVQLLFDSVSSSFNASDTYLTILFKDNKKKNTISFIKHNIIGGRRDYYDLRNVPLNNRNYFRNNLQFNPYLSAEDFEQTSLNKYEIEVYVELTNKSLSENEIGCFAKKQKMIYNAKELFSYEKVFDFTKIANMDLYDPDMDLSSIKPYLDLSYNNKN